MLHLGPLPAPVADALVQRKGAKGALPDRAHAPTAALGCTAAIRALAPLPSPPALICISHDCDQSGLVSLEADGFGPRGKGVAGGACAAVADLNRGFYCCSLFPPPSLLFSLSLFLFFRPSWGSAVGEEEKDRGLHLSLTFLIFAVSKTSYSTAHFSILQKNYQVSFLAIFVLRLLF